MVQRMISKPTAKIVPIREDVLESVEVRGVADLAFDLWLANGFRGGSPEEALFISVSQWQQPAARLFLVPK
jgi:hypothetical protein